MRNAIIGLLLLCSLPQVMAVGPTGKMVLFVLQADRQRTTLENDAVLMANTISAADPGDYVQAITTTGTDIVSWDREGNTLNPLESTMAKNRTINIVRGFFLKQFSGTAHGADNDVAGAIAVAMDRFNHAPAYTRALLVILSSGLQRDRSVNFKGCYPSDSWLIHELSPFAAVKPNTTRAKLEVVMVSQKSDYVNTYHQAKIERFYQLLFHQKRCQLISFTTDHQSATQVILHGGPPLLNPPTSENLNGPLTLTKVSGLLMEEP